MDVINAEQARIAEEAGACAVMALERVPADIRKNGKLFLIFLLFLGVRVFLKAKNNDRWCCSYV